MTSAGAVGVDVLPEFRSFGARYRTGITSAIRGSSSRINNEYRRQGESAGRSMSEGTDRSIRGNRGARGFISAGHKIGSSFRTGVIAPIGGLPGIIGGIMGGAAVAATKSWVNAASNAEETLNKSRVVFGRHSAEIELWAMGAAENLGMASSEAIAGAAQFGNFFDQLGFGAKESVKMSKGFVQMATDAASFNNANPAEVMEAFSAATRGEYDSLQKFIPTVSAATVEAEAMRMTHKKSAEDLTAADKAAALYALSTKDLGKAHGDFARTSDSYANQQRILSANFLELKERLGNAFMPAAIRMSKWMNNTLVPILTRVASFLGHVFAGRWDRARQVLVHFFRDAVAWVKATVPKWGAALGEMGKKLITWITPRIGPAILQLAKWYARIVKWIWTVAVPGIGRWLWKMGAKLVAWIGPRIGPTIDKIVEWATRIYNWIKTTGIPRLQRFLTDMGQRLVAWIGPRIGPTQKKIGEWAGRFLAWILTTGIPRLVKFLTIMGLKLISWILPRIPGTLAKLAVWGLKLQAWLLLKGVPMIVKGVLRIGWGLITGFKQGIDEKMRDIGSWIKAHVIDPIISKVKSFFGIKSPSRVFQGIGGMLIAGLFKGMSSGAPTTMIKTIFGGMPDALAALVSKGLISVSSLPSKAMNALSGMGSKLLGALGGALGSGPFLGGLKPVPGSGNRHNSGYAHADYAGDFPNPLGTPIRAWKTGVVTATNRWGYSYGHHVKLNHGTARTLYAHMDQIFVRLGQLVRAGQVIGTVDSTGNSTGNHLHFEKYDQGGWLRPGATMAVNQTRHDELVLTKKQQDALFSGARRGGHVFNISAREIPVPRQIIEAQQRADLLDKLGSGIS